jgi:hypothetical protein
VAPGAHTPEHTPVTHAWFVQATGAPHTPLAMHVSTPLPEHRVELGVQTPGPEHPAVQAPVHW